MDSDKPKNTGKAPEPTTEAAEPQTASPATDTTSTPASPATGTQPAPAAKPNKNLWMMIAAIASVVVIVVVVVLFIVLGGKDKDNNGDDASNKGDSSQVDSDKDSKDEGKLDKTLAVTGMTMHYGSGWKVDKTDENENGIYKGDEYYILLNHVDGAGKKFTTKEYAEAFLSAFEDSDVYDIREKPVATKVNGLEWQKAVVYAEGVWMTMWFYADGTDYYLATFGNMKSSKVPAEIQAMIDTLTIKKK